MSFATKTNGFSLALAPPVTSVKSQQQPQMRP